MAISLRFISRLLSALLLLASLLFISIWMLLRGSMPQYVGEASLTQLTAPVMIERDILGSVTLQAKNRLDLARALGFVHGQERFFEMDLMRRRAAGELAEVFGPAALATDRKARQFRMRAHALVILEQLPFEQRQLLEAYRDGVNNGLHALSVRPYMYLLTRTQPIAWQSEDSLLVILSMFFTLNESSIYRELAFSTMRASLPESAYRFLTASGGAWDAPLIGKPLDWPQIPTADEFNLQTLDPNLLQDDYEYSDYMPGSNSFAVSGALTAGAALVANDMHLALRVPNLWFRTRLMYPKNDGSDARYDITGASLPGIPIVVTGSNRYIAWSFTNSYGDFADWIRIKLDPADHLRYLGKNGWAPIQRHHEVLRVRGAPDETLIVHETEWGPLLAIDHDETPLALIWTALKPDAVNLKLIELEQAETAEEAIAIAQYTGMPVQNFIVGDRDGNILWTIAGRIPLRTGNYDPKLPADWTISDTGWNGWLENRQYPLIRNPVSNRLWTANTRTVSGTALDLLGDGGYDLGARAKQIRNSLFLREQFAPLDMLSIQLDYRALFLARWQQLLESVLHQSTPAPWLTRMQQALEDWNGLASIDSVSYRVVRAFRKEVIKRVLDGFAAAVRAHYPNFKLPRLNQAEHAVWALIEQRPQHLLPPGVNDWNELLLASAKEISLQLESEPGGITARSWGEFNMARIHHPISNNLPTLLANWLNMPANALPGDSNMPRVQAPAFGASQRSAVEPGNEEGGYFDMPGGQSGHPLSPYYGSGHANWVKDQPTPFLPGPPEKTLRLIPAANAVNMSN